MENTQETPTHGGFTTARSQASLAGQPASSQASQVGQPASLQASPAGQLYSSDSSPEDHQPTRINTVHIAQVTLYLTEV